MTTPILVAGIGNIFLGDDGFGSEVARRVKSPGRDVRVVDYGIRGMHLAYDLLDGCAALVLIDALPVRETPGTLHVFEADHDRLGPATGVDAHAMDPTSVFASLTALGGTPPHTIVVGCEVADLTEGMGLSTAVAAAVPGAVSAVEDVLAALVAGRPARAG